jgi:Ca2+-binding EF-hand superfamily protein
MKSSILASVALGLALPAGAAAQRANDTDMRFQAMDANHDGVITRDEWRGSARAFRNQDRNGDGVLSGDEVRQSGTRRRGANGTAADDRFRQLDTNGDGRVSVDEWRGSRAVFDALDANHDGVLTAREALGTRATSGRGDEFDAADVNGDGLVSASEWQWNRAAFDRLDVNHDGRLTRAEWESTQAAPPAPRQSTQTVAYRTGYDRGHRDGVQAGKEDKPRHWDLEGQRELETADAGYQPAIGSRADYQAGYRAGFRLGYAEGFGPRS